MREVIILAGGQGTRLNSVISDVPKPMAPINGRPFLEYLLDRLIQQRVDRVILSVGYKAEQIISHFGEEYKKLNIKYVIEKKPLGTGGAIKKCLYEIIENETFVMNGDTYSDICLRKMEEVKTPTDTIIMAVKEVLDISRYGSVVIRGGVVRGFNEKGCLGKGFINIGTYLINKSVLDNYKEDFFFSFESDFLMKHYMKNNFKAYDECSKFIDIGIPDDYHKAQSYLTNL